MREVILRAPTLNDVDAAVALINEEAVRLTGSPAVNARAIHGWWTLPPPFDLGHDVVLATESTALVGYGDLSERGDERCVFWLDVRGGAKDAVYAELERRAAERAAADALIRAFSDATDEAHRAVLERRGYRAIRASYRMEIELPGRTFTPVWPTGAAVRSAALGTDEELLHELADRSFADHWDFTPEPHDEWLHWLLHMAEPDPTLWFVAEVDGEPAGIAICRPSEWGDPGCGWVATLGVVPAHRGRGLGTALLTHALAAFQRRGLPRAGLGVDAENTTGAVALYERAGMRVVRRHDTWELSL